MLARTPLLIETDLVQQRQDERARRRKRRGQKAARRTRVLVHIGKKPAQAHPAHSGWARETGRSGRDETPEGKWERPGRKPTKTGAFLTNNPVQVATQHGIFGGNVYAYKVPERTIRKSGGLRKFDHATELLVPGEHWPRAKLLGKRMDRTSFHQTVKRAPEEVKIAGDPTRAFGPKSKKQKKRDKKAADIERRQQGRKKMQTSSVELSRAPLLIEALQVRRQSSKERMAKKRPSATFGAKRAAKWLWQQMRKKWSKEHPQYIFRKGKLIFVAPEKRRQLKSKIKGRIVKRSKLPGSGSHG